MTNKNTSEKSKHVLLIGGGIVVLVIIIIFGSAKLMSSGKEEKGASAVSIGQGDSVKTKETTEVYRKQIEEHNTEQRKRAEQQGRSVLPILLPSQPEPQPTSAELKAKRAESEKAEKQARNGAASAAPPAEPPVSAEAMQAKTEAMRGMINALLQRPQPSRNLVMAVVPEDTKKVAAPGSPQTVSGVPQTAGSKVTAPPIAYAGDTIFAVLNSYINTDEPDMVHLTVTSGPLKGGTLVGTATRQKEVVKVVVTSLFLDRKAYDLTGQVMDIDTARGVLSGEVDRKLIQRYGLPFVSGFITGLGQALAQGGTQTSSTTGAIGLGGTTSITTSPLNTRQIAGASIGAGAQGINQQIQSSARNTEPSVFIPGGMPVGVFLLSDVVMKSGPDTKAATALEAVQQAAPQQVEQRNYNANPQQISPYGTQPRQIQYPPSSAFSTQRQGLSSLYGQ